MRFFVVTNTCGSSSPVFSTPRINTSSNDSLDKLLPRRMTSVRKTSTSVGRSSGLRLAVGSEPNSPRLWILRMQLATRGSESCVRFEPRIPR